MVGFAVTYKVDSTTPGRRPDSSRIAELTDAVKGSRHPVVVVCQEAGPIPEKGCHMGDVVGTRLARNGAVGIVSGAGIRDLDGMRDVGLSAFACGTVVSHGVFTITEVNCEVDVAGLHVRPGDLLHGDSSGLVAVPSDEPDTLMQLIAEVKAKEAESRKRTEAAKLEY
jgi:regulator of RNase E activity RraA